MKNTDLITAIFGFFLFAVKTLSLENAIPQYTITADELLNDFSNDENDASLKYDGHVLQVSGKILNVSKSDSDSKIVLKAGNKIIDGVHCSFLKLEDNLQKNDIVTVKGRCQKYLTGVVLNNCILEK